MRTKQNEHRIYTEILIALAMEYFQTGDFMAGTIADYADMFGLSRNAARRVLFRLVRDGQIEKIRDGGVTRYHLARSWIEL